MSAIHPEQTFARQLLLRVCVSRTVPRYFFHLFNDVTACDGEGVEPPDEGAALQEAIINVRALAAETVCEGKLNLNHRIEIRNAQGETVRTVYFRDALEIQD